MQKTISIPVSREAFNRIIKGEQTVIYRTYSNFWLKKLYNTRTFKRKFDYVMITTGILEERKTVWIKLKTIETKEQGKIEWGAPKGKVFALHIDQIEKNNYESF